MFFMITQTKARYFLILHMCVSHFFYIYYRNVSWSGFQKNTWRWKYTKWNIEVALQPSLAPTPRWAPSTRWFTSIPLSRYVHMCTYLLSINGYYSHGTLIFFHLIISLRDILVHTASPHSLNSCIAFCRREEQTCTLKHHIWWTSGWSSSP